MGFNSGFKGLNAKHVATQCLHVANFDILCQVKSHILLQWFLERIKNGSGTHARFFVEGLPWGYIEFV